MYNAHYFYTSYGRVLAFGVNTNGQLNLGANETAAATIPVVMDIPGRNISSIASKVNNLFATDGCEYGTNITVTPSNCAVDNYIYGLGSNTYSQVAGDGSTTNQYIPLLANIQRNIVTIAAGTGFAVVLTTTGNMYAWGLNQNGQLGDGSNINRATPVAVNTNGLTSRIVDVKCGSTSCYALSSDNGFYSWGGNTNIISKVPVGSMGTAVIKSFKVGISHVLVLTTNDRVFTMGDNTLYSLGDGSTSKYMLSC
jgi:alpha-tubulin suppressor-like RCC1 family protein